MKKLVVLTLTLLSINLVFAQNVREIKSLERVDTLVDYRGEIIRLDSIYTYRSPNTLVVHPAIASKQPMIRGIVNIRVITVEGYFPEEIEVISEGVQIETDDYYHYSIDLSDYDGAAVINLEIRERSTLNIIAVEAFRVQNLPSNIGSQYSLKSTAPQRVTSNRLIRSDFYLSKIDDGLDSPLYFYDIPNSRKLEGFELIVPGFTPFIIEGNKIENNDEAAKALLGSKPGTEVIINNVRGIDEVPPTTFILN